MPPEEVALRLAIATLVGAILGYNRELHDKPAGLKTLALVSLGGGLAPIVILSSTEPGPDAISRVLQGVLTGVGFLGAGVIMHRESVGVVKGLTTAAVVWVVAGLGLAAGMGLHWPVLIGTGLALLILTLGHRFERRVGLDDDAS
jgi:putative Mg2+ transporter-C (MgtC) family protein